MITKRISIRQAVPGMIAAEDIYNYNNQLVISIGTKLTDKIITRLKFYLINEFRIMIEENKDTRIPPKEELTRTQMIRETAEFKKFNQAFVDTVQDFKGELNNLTNPDATLNEDKLLEQTTNILSNSRNGIHVFDMLHSMREYDDITYVHSINVSLICNVFGHWLKLPEKDIEILTLCGMMHDIGKLTIPDHVINKQEPLTAAELLTVKSHTIRGYQILKNKEIDKRIKNCTLMHHERCDGSGYPNKLKGPQIDSFSKIVAIADVYDAMTSPRVYRPALSPFEAIENFETDGLQKYDPQYIMIFLEEIVQSYVGKHIRLNNKSEGEIRMINKHNLAKPVVQVGSMFLDLSKENDLFIETILN